MSHPARFDYGHSRYPGSGGYSGPRARPVPGPHWMTWGVPTPGSAGMDGGGIHHPTPLQQSTDTWGRNPAADGWGRTPAAHSTPWAGGVPEQEWGINNTPAKPTPLMNQWTNWSSGPEDVNRFYPPGENFSHQIDRQQKRMKWREEILKGDPEKAINDGLPDASRLVITFIARGSPEHPHGQGLEILRFRPPRRPQHFPPSAHDGRTGWAHFTMDACSLIKVKEDDVILSAAELSTRPFACLLPNLDVKKDLKLVRRSKPLLWDETTVLESFLYRIVEEKEDPESEAGKDLAQRLGGPAFHGWYQTSEIQASTTTPDSDLISTALNAVCLPPHLSAVVDSMFADQESRPEQLALRALEALYACVQLKHGRLAFKFYPIPPPPIDQPEHLVCDKRRVWAYWTEVLAWHLSQLREDAGVSISYSLLKSLSAVRDSVDDPKVTLDELERIMVAAIAAEADRSRHATNTLIHEAVCECLHNQSFAPPEKSLGKMHIITTGSSSIVYSVISKLITHVLARKISPAESTTANRKILDLKITVAESRPLDEGVILATKLGRVVESYMEYRDRASKQAKRTSGAPSTADLGNVLFDPEIHSRMIKAMSEKEQMNSPMRLHPPTLGLSHLLADLDAKKEKKEPKVTIELITDAAVVSTTMASGGSGVKPIILLSADRVLPNGDSVNKVGSAQMAWAGKSSGGVVLILCRADRVHSKELPIPSKPSNPSDELIAGWKSTIGEEIMLEIKESNHVTISNPTYDDIDHKDITGYITELGLMQNNMLTEFSNMRSDLEKIVWPVNALTK